MVPDMFETTVAILPAALFESRGERKKNGPNAVGIVAEHERVSSLKANSEIFGQAELAHRACVKREMRVGAREVMKARAAQHSELKIFGIVGVEDDGGI